MELDPGPILEVLDRHGVDYVLIGGLAGLAHGSQYPTQDTDIAYDRSCANLERLSAALIELEATLRGAPADLPFEPGVATLANGANFTFDTLLGPLDVLAEPAGAPPYARLRAEAELRGLLGVCIPVASLDHLIAMKEAAGRPKDLLMASEYRAISDELRRPADAYEEASGEWSQGDDGRLWDPTAGDGID
ncbi:MAG: hypothetical protein U0R50_10090 [Gaiellales bacterium]